MDDVLEQLDRAYAGYKFPAFSNGYWYPVCARLHVFRDATDWAVVIEKAGYNETTGTVADLFYRFGSAVPEARRGLTDDDIVSRVDNMDDLLEAEEDEGELSDPEVTIAGRTRTVPGRYSVLDLARHLGETSREELLGRPDEVRAALTRELPELLVLDDWPHDDDVPPSGSETFRMIARAIRSGDPADYAPTAPGNTHWRNWPEAGQL